MVHGWRTLKNATNLGDLNRLSKENLWVYDTIFFLYNVVSNLSPEHMFGWSYFSSKL